MPVDAIRLTPPLSRNDTEALRAGDRVLIDGTIYTARDAAHSRLIKLIEAGGELPLDLEGQVIYYTGPTPASPGRATGSAGPTTSMRMDRHTRAILELGVRALIGKGSRGEDVAEALKRHGAVYLAAVGGAGALLGERIREAEPVAYEELGTEAIHRLRVESFPAIVAIDSHGGDIFVAGRERYKRV